MNKRGDIAVVVLVFLILIVCGIALLDFSLTSNGFNGKILNSQFIEGIYGQELSLKFYLRELTEPIFLKSYFSALSSGRPVILEGEAFFFFDSSMSDLVLENELKNLFANNLKFSKFSEKELSIFSELNLVQQKLQNGKFSIEGDLDKIVLNISGISFSETFQEQNLFVSYSPEILLDYSIKDFGLVSIQNLSDYKNGCLAGEIDERIDCLKKESERFPQFIVEVFKSDDDKIFVKMKSKRQFLFDNSLQNVFIRFFLI